MRFAFYGIAWTCFVLGFACAGFAFPGSRSELVSTVLVACALLMGALGYAVARATTRKCRACGERIGLRDHSCNCCGSTFGPAEGD